MISQQSPIPPLLGQAELFDLQNDPKEQQDLSSTETDRVESFLRESHRRWQEQSCHLLLKAANRSQQDMEIGIKGTLNRFKDIGGVCDDCTAYADSWLKLHLDHGEELSLILERSDTWQLETRIRIHPPHQEPFQARGKKKWTFPEKRPHSTILSDGPMKVQLSKDGSWLIDEPDSLFDPDTSGTGMTVEWRGAGCPWLTGETTATSVIDEETRRQLEALGYIDN